MGDNHTRNSAEPRAPEANVRIVGVTSPLRLMTGRSKRAIA